MQIKGTTLGIKNNNENITTTKQNKLSIWKMNKSQKRKRRYKYMTKFLINKYIYNIYVYIYIYIYTYLLIYLINLKSRNGNTAEPDFALYTEIRRMTLGMILIW